MNWIFWLYITSDKSIYCPKWEKKLYFTNWRDFRHNIRIFLTDQQFFLSNLFTFRKVFILFLHLPPVFYSIIFPENFHTTLISFDFMFHAYLLVCKICEPEYIQRIAFIRFHIKFYFIFFITWNAKMAMPSSFRWIMMQKWIKLFYERYQRVTITLV